MSKPVRLVACAITNTSQHHMMQHPQIDCGSVSYYFCYLLFSIIFSLVEFSHFISPCLPNVDIPGFLTPDFGVKRSTILIKHQHILLSLFVSCRYKDYRDNNGKFTLFYWELLAIRLGFIIAFEVRDTFGIMLPILFKSVMLFALYCTFKFHGVFMPLYLSV